MRKPKLSSKLNWLFIGKSYGEMYHFENDPFRSSCVDVDRFHVWKQDGDVLYDIANQILCSLKLVRLRMLTLGGA